MYEEIKRDYEDRCRSYEALSLRMFGSVAQNSIYKWWKQEIEFCNKMASKEQDYERA